MNPWERFILQFIQAVAPTVENLFIHNQRSIAIFNTSDTLFNGIVQALTPPPAPPGGPPSGPLPPIAQP